MKQTPPQWAIKQHLENSPKCEWLCTHSNLNNLGEVKTPPKTPSTTSKPVELSNLIDLYTIDIAYASRRQKVGNFSLEKLVFERAIQSLIDKQVLEGRIDTADYLVKRFVTVYREGEFIEFVADYIDALQTNNKEKKV